MARTYYVEVWTVNGMVGRGVYNNLADLHAENKGYAIRAWAMSRGLYNDGKRPYGWDAPTFKLQSTKVIDTVPNPPVCGVV